MEPQFSPIHSENHKANLSIDIQVTIPRILLKPQSSQSILSNSAINKENPDQEKKKNSSLPEWVTIFRQLKGEGYKILIWHPPTDYNFEWKIKIVSYGQAIKTEKK